MATIPRQQINRARALFRRDFHKEATPEAGRVVRVLLDAIVEDPDPRWVPGQIPTHVLVERVVAELPMIFEISLSNKEPMLFERRMYCIGWACEFQIG